MNREKYRDTAYFGRSIAFGVFGGSLWNEDFKFAAIMFGFGFLFQVILEET